MHCASTQHDSWVSAFLMPFWSVMFADVCRYDRILVLDHGVVKEFDKPMRLFDAGGLFHKMCSSSGIDRKDVQQQQQRVTAGSS